MSTSPVTLVPTTVLVSLLSASVDLWCCLYDDDCLDESTCTHFTENLAILLAEKYEECTEEFKGAVLKEFTAPICVQLLPHAVRMGNGHHRLSIAIRHNLPCIPVVFTDEDDYMLSHITSPQGTLKSFGGYVDRYNV